VVRGTRMNIRFGSIGAFAVVMIGGLTGKAQAQLVTVQNWTFVPANPASVPPGRATINPSGTYSVPPPPQNVMQNWKVVLDYGTLANGTFTVLAQQPGTGLVAPLVITNLNNNGTWNFGGNPGGTLSAPANMLPANTAARIRLHLKQPNGQFVPIGNTVFLPLN
jgi:hypothetical protein